MTARTGLVTPQSTNGSDGYVTISIRPLLLDRKRRIYARIRELADKPAEQILRSLAEGDASPAGAKEAAADALEKLQAGRAAAQQEAALDPDLMKQDALMQMAERKAKIWQGFLARESIASIAGGVLLVAFAIANCGHVCRNERDRSRS